MSDIEPIYITPALLSPSNLQQLDGVELDLLDGLGVHIAMLQPTNRAMIALGWIQLRRKHPGVSFEDAKPHIIWRLGDDAESEVPPDVDPTSGTDSVS